LHSSERGRWTDGIWLVLQNSIASNKKGLRKRGRKRERDREWWGERWNVVSPVINCAKRISTKKYFLP
jgi:hypothetical protein